MSGNAQHKHWPPQLGLGCWRLGSCDIDCSATRHRAPVLARTVVVRTLEMGRLAWHRQHPSPCLLNINSCHTFSQWMAQVRPWALTTLWTHLPSYSLMFRAMVSVIFKPRIESHPPTVIGNLSPVQWSCNRQKVDIFPWSPQCLQIAVQRNVSCPLPR